MDMAAGAVPSLIPGLRTRDSALSFAKSVDFARVSCAPEQSRMKLRRRHAAVIRSSSNSGSEIVELESAAEGSPLLGTEMFFYRRWLGCLT